MNIELRKITLGDLEQIMIWRNSKEVSQYMYTDPKLTIEMQRQWFEKIQNEKTTKYWLMALDGVRIGLMCLTDIDEHHQRCNIGHYIADASLRGRGIGGILECNINDYVFDIMGLNKVCFEVIASNKRAISLHEKFGAQIEGIRKQHIYKNGEFIDIVEMGTLKDNWIKHKVQFTYDKIKIEEI